jgi:Big-like domain-containing protein
MRRSTACLAVGLVIALVGGPTVASAARTEVSFDLDDPSSTIFPSNFFTVIDLTQNTFRRVSLPKPDCTAQALACEDIDVLNSLDGFSPQPRISIPFSGPIDVSTVNSNTVFLLSLGSTLGGGSFRDQVGINQIVWDPASNTLHVQSDELLAPHTRYAIIVTNGVRDADGDPIVSHGFERFQHALDRDHLRDEIARAFHAEVMEALDRGQHGHAPRIVAVSVFTTLSTTAAMENIRRQLDAARPAPVSFTIGSNGERAVFPVSAVTSIVFNRQVGTAPTFAASNLNVNALQIVPGAVGQIAFGSFTSPNFLVPGEFIPRVGTRTQSPAQHGSNQIFFNLFIPSGPKPAGGWPVAIFGHGFGSNKEAAPFVLAAKMAQQGIAVIAINVVGHSGGPLGTLRINTATGSVTVPAGGRGIDQNGDGRIDGTEGSSAVRPNSLMGSADALRQTITDIMQLVREIRVGVDIDGDGAPDLDPSRTYYFGQSFGGIYGTMFLAIEPNVRVGVPNVAGGPAIEIVRLSPVFRNAIFAPAAAAHGLANLPPITVGGVVIPQFNENIPLRDQPPVINTVPGAMELQEFIDRASWANRIGDPVAYAPHIRKAPLAGVPAKSIIFLFAKGDQTVPNPTASAIIRAGDFADRATFYRNDLAFAMNPATPKNPHTFLTNVAAGGLGPTVALEAQTQVATFFASDGATTIDPDGAGPLFETPIVGAPPETLNFIP